MGGSVGGSVGGRGGGSVGGGSVGGGGGGPWGGPWGGGGVDPLCSVGPPLLVSASMQKQSQHILYDGPPTPLFVNHILKYGQFFLSLSWPLSHSLLSHSCP